MARTSLIPNTLLSENSDWFILVVSDINNSGQIVGTGLLDGVERGFVFDLVTEPSTPFRWLRVQSSTRPGRLTTSDT